MDEEVTSGVKKLASLHVRFMKTYLLQSGESEFFFDAGSGLWSFRFQRGVMMEAMTSEIEINQTLRSCFGEHPLVEQGSGADEDFGPFAQLTVASLITPERLRLVVDFRLYHEGAFLTIALGVEHLGEAAIALGLFKPFCYSPVGRVEMGADASEIRLLCQSAWVLGNALRRVGEGRHLSRTVGLLYHPSSRGVLNSSFLSFDRAATEVVYTDETGKLALEGRCDFAGFVLKAGGSITSEVAYLEGSCDPFDSLEKWAQRAATRYQPRFAERPSIGWVGGWTWRDGFTQEIYEELVRENIAAIANQLSGFGVEHIWVSIANIKRMLPGLWQEENAESFPHGLEWLVRELKGYGMKLGLWVAPFWIPDKLCDLFETHRDHLLKQGNQYVWNNYQLPYGVSGTLPEGERVGFYSLDGSHPRSLAFLREVFGHYRKLGVRYFMIDFLYAGSGSTPGHFPYDFHWDQSKIRGPEVYRQALQVIRESVGEETYLLSSTGTTFQHIGCVDAVRVGPDIGEGRPLIPTMATYPATYKIGNWALIQTVAATMAFTYFTDRRFYYNDAFNVLTVDRPVPLTEAQATITMFALSGGPVMLGDDIATIAKERLTLIKKCLPQYHTMAKPVDLFRAVHPDVPKVFHLHLHRDWDEWEVVGILNAGSETLHQRLDFRQLGLNAEVRYALFDFWDEAYLGEAMDTCLLEIQARSARVVRICRVRSHPWLLASDMHVTQGAVEVEELRWDGPTRTLTGVCSRPIGETGNLYFSIPKGWKPVSYTGLNVAKDAATGAVLAMKRFNFKQTSVAWNIAFECYLPAAEHNDAGL